MELRRRLGDPARLRDPHRRHALSATNYLQAFWGPLGDGDSELALALAFIAYVAVRNVVGFSATRGHRIALLVVADFVLQVFLIVAGLIEFFSWDRLTDPIDLGTTPTWRDLVFAAGLATVVFTGLESASGLSGEVAIGRRGLRRLVASAGGVVVVIYVGIALVAVTALPVSVGRDAVPGRWLEAPMLERGPGVRHTAGTPAPWPTWWPPPERRR